MKKLFALLIACLLLSACGGNGDEHEPDIGQELELGMRFNEDFIYEIWPDENVKIHRYIGSSPDVIVPSEIDGNTVFMIENWAFLPFYSEERFNYFFSGYDLGIEYNDLIIAEVETLYLPDTLIQMPFLDNNKTLRTVNVPSSITEIRPNTFAGSINLVEVDISDTVTRIGLGTFHACESLISVRIPEGVTDIRVNTFNGCISLEEVILPSTLISIHEWVFYDCVSLKEIIIPDNIEHIGAHAFRNCKSLREIVIPEGIIELSNLVFSGCDSLEKLYLPRSLEKITERTFEGMPLATLTIYCYSDSKVPELLDWHPGKFNIEFIDE